MAVLGPHLVKFEMLSFFMPRGSGSLLIGSISTCRIARRTC